MNKLKMQLAALLALMAAAVPAFALDAAISTALSTAFGTVVTDAGALTALVIVPIIGVLGYSLTIKLVKRFGNKI
jgi:hypothetical protein